jgi:uncharacterized protein
MSTSTSDYFSILQRSPLDKIILPAEALPNEQESARLMGSRFNIQATAEDGRLVIWNTLRGSISVFSPEQRQDVKRMLRRKPFEAPLQGLAGYLKERGFLVSEGTDEYRRFRLLAGQQHYRNDLLELTLLASEDCNFRCQYCYERFARGTMRAYVREGIKKMIASRIPGLRHLRIAWFGGEPLYGLVAIEDLSKFCLEIAERHSILYSASMTTNGYLLTPDVADKLLSWRIVNYQITLDGPPQFHDRKRPTRTGEGSFHRIFNNLKSLSARPDTFYVNLRVNFDRENYPVIEEFLDLIQQELGADERFQVRFKAVGRWGGANDASLPVLEGNEETKARFHLIEAARQRGLYTCDKVNQRNIPGGQVCYAARPFHYVIGASGNVMKCTVDLDAKNANVVGQIGSDSELAMDWEKLSAWTESDYQTDERCKDCVVLPLCQAQSCPAVRLSQGKNPCTPIKFALRQELLAALAERGATMRRIEIGRTAPTSGPQPRDLTPAGCATLSSETHAEPMGLS